MVPTDALAVPPLAATALAVPGSVTLVDFGAFLFFAGVLAVVVWGFLATVYRLVRYATAPRRTPGEVARLEPGDYWLAVEGAVAARGESVDAALEDDQVVTARVRAWIQECFRGLRFFRADVTDTPTVDVTNAAPFALDDHEADVVFHPEGSVEVMGADWNSKDAFYWPEDRVPERLASFLETHGLDVDNRIYHRLGFTHVLRVNRDAVRDGDAVRIVGPVTVAETGSGGTRLTPRASRVVDVILTTASRRRILVRYLRDLFWSLVGLSLFGVLAALFGYVLHAA